MTGFFAGKKRKLFVQNTAPDVARAYYQSILCIVSCSHSKLSGISCAEKAIIRCFPTRLRRITTLSNNLYQEFTKGPVKLMQRVKAAHSIFQSVSNMFHFIILSLAM